MDQFSLVSGWSGACQFWYEELEGLLLNEPEPLTAAGQKAAIEKSVSDGSVFAGKRLERRVPVLV